MPLLALVSALAQFAPTIAGWLGGPQAEQSASKVVDIAKTVTAAATGDDALVAIQSSPEMAEKFKEAVLNQHLELSKLAYQQNEDEIAYAEKEDALSASDVADARKMQVANHSWMPACLTVFITIGFFGMLAALVWREVPASNQAIINVMLGSLGTAWVSAVGFWLGSSYGSLRKTDQMAAVAGVQTPTATPPDAGQ